MRELVARLKDLAARERGVTAALVAHLAELETRSLHLQAGYGSLFVYCRDALRLSEHESYNRIEVARAARRYPVILERLASGDVNLTTIRLLAPYLTPENHLHVLDEARGKKKSAVEEMVARLAPWPDEPVVIRKLPAPRVVSVAVPLSSAQPAPQRRLVRLGRRAVAASQSSAPPPSQAASPAPPSLAPRPAAVVPLSPDRYKLQVTIAGETLEKLRLAKDMLRHALPSGDEALLLDRALTSLLADLARRKFAATDGRDPARNRLPDPATSRPRSGARCGCATSAAARSWRGTAAAAASAPSWSSTTCGRTPWAEKPRPTTSSCGAGATTTTKARCSSGRRACRSRGSAPGFRPPGPAGPGRKGRGQSRRRRSSPRQSSPGQLVPERVAPPPPDT